MHAFLDLYACMQYVRAYVFIHLCMYTCIQSAFVRMCAHVCPSIPFVLHMHQNALHFKSDVRKKNSSAHDKELNLY